MNVAEHIILFSGGVSAAALLLAAEPQGLAIDFATMSMAIKDTTTPANTFDGDPNSKLTYTAPGTKLIRGANGLWSAGSTLRTAYDATLNPLGVLIEEARTNLCLQSNDLTSATWTKSNVNTTLTATGPDGVANSATTVTAIGANGTVSQSITSGSAQRLTTAFLRRRTGTGNVDLTQDGGLSWVTQAVTSSWTPFTLTPVTSANPVIGLRIVTSGDAVDVAYFQHELGAFATSPIVTAGSTATRVRDSISIASSLFPNGTGQTFHAITKNLLVTPSGGNTNILGVNAAATASLYCGNDSTASYYNGTSSISKVHGGSFTGGTVKVASSSDASNASVTGNGLAPTTGALGLAAISSMQIGSQQGVGAFLNGYLNRLIYLPRRMSDAELQGLTT